MEKIGGLELVNDKNYSLSDNRPPDTFVRSTRAKIVIFGRNSLRGVSGDCALYTGGRRLTRQACAARPIQIPPLI